jgi:hypothetical protein
MLPNQCELSREGLLTLERNRLVDIEVVKQWLSVKSVNAVKRRVAQPHRRRREVGPDSRPTSAALLDAVRK